MRIASAGSTLAVALLTTALLAVSAAPEDLARTHDGEFARVSVGGGTAGSAFDGVMDGPGTRAKVELSGTSGEMNLALGGVVAPNLAVHATLWGWAIRNPKVTWSDSTSHTLEGAATMTAIGVGVTYYFMPANVYASGSVGLGRLRFSGDVSGETGNGPALDLTVGKEWWVGPSWGLGVAAGFSYHSLPDKGTVEPWSGTSFGLRLSATYD
jgi:hypothetical protein